MAIEISQDKLVEQPAKVFDKCWLESLKISARPGGQSMVNARLRPMCTEIVEGVSTDYFSSSPIDIYIPSLESFAATLEPVEQMLVGGAKEAIFQAVQLVAQKQGKI